MEFKNPDDASRALATMNGHPFDAKHTFFINRFTDFERYLSMDETYEEPEPEEYKAKVRRGLTARCALGPNVAVGTLARLARRPARP